MVVEQRINSLKKTLWDVIGSTFPDGNDHGHAKFLTRIFPGRNFQACEHASTALTVLPSYPYSSAGFRRRLQVFTVASFQFSMARLAPELLARVWREELDAKS